ncbi:MAG: hypothetical protein ABIH42_08645 [Planctomycetota bacterium]
MKRLFILFVISFIAVSILIAQDQTEKQLSQEEALKGKITKLKIEVEKIRGKNFKEEIKVTVKNKEDLRTMILKDMEKEWSKEYIDKAKKVLVKFGYIKPELDLAKMVVDVFSEAIAGFYNPEDKELCLIKDAGSGVSQEEENFAAAHELTHALQDQYFDLRSFNRWVIGNDDHGLSLKALTEGEATLLGFEYVMKKTVMNSIKTSPVGTLGDLMRMSIDLKKTTDPNSALAKAPAILIETTLFQYIKGTDFCHYFLKKNDWKDFDKLYENPPTSTEQIIHPEKFFDKIDYPTLFKMPELKKVLGEEWELLENNCVGELALSILVKEFLTPQKAKKASEGWDGDKFQVLEDKKSNRIIIAWITTWDSDKDAHEFASIYTDILKKKYNKPAEVVNNASFIYINSEAEVACVELCNQDVMVIEGASASEIEKIRPEILKSVKIVTQEIPMTEFTKKELPVSKEPPKEESPKKELPQDKEIPQNTKEF